MCSPWCQPRSATVSITSGPVGRRQRARIGRADGVGFACDPDDPDAAKRPGLDGVPACRRSWRLVGHRARRHDYTVDPRPLQFGFMVVPEVPSPRCGQRLGPSGPHRHRVNVLWKMGHAMSRRGHPSWLLVDIKGRPREEPVPIMPPRLGRARLLRPADPDRHARRQRPSGVRRCTNIVPRAPAAHPARVFAPAPPTVAKHFYRATRPKAPGRRTPPGRQTNTPRATRPKSGRRRAHPEGTLARGSAGGCPVHGDQRQHRAGRPPGSHPDAHGDRVACRPARWAARPTRTGAMK
jgi:hypothetical protein